MKASYGPLQPHCYRELMTAYPLSMHHHITLKNYENENNILSIVNPDKQFIIPITPPMTQQ